MIKIKSHMMMGKGNPDQETQNGKLKDRPI